MTQSFSFSFAGDDIEEEESPPDNLTPARAAPIRHAAETGTLRRPTPSSSQRNSAFPISGHALLPALSHSLDSLLATLPSTISYSTLPVTLDDGSVLGIPRREMWDVRLQLMAEEAHEAQEFGLGTDDIKTGVYEGGFKSWESSVDLVKVLGGRWAGGGSVLGMEGEGRKREVLEMGCGTALPTLALLQWQLSQPLSPPPSSTGSSGSTRSLSLSLKLADYNPSVLQLVTAPNLLLSWAKWHHGPTWSPEGDLDISVPLLNAFRSDLNAHDIKVSFYSGAWSSAFVDLVTALAPGETTDIHPSLLVLAAETIYSPVALRAFSESLMDILQGGEERGTGGDGGQQDEREALIAAKKVYFGVGGSMEDFVTEVQGRGGLVVRLREEEEGVRRAVVAVRMGKKGTGELE